MRRIEIVTVITMQDTPDDNHEWVQKAREAFPERVQSVIVGAIARLGKEMAGPNPIRLTGVTTEVVRDDIVDA